MAILRFRGSIGMATRKCGIVFVNSSSLLTVDLSSNEVSVFSLSLTVELSSKEVIVFDEDRIYNHQCRLQDQVFRDSFNNFQGEHLAFNAIVKSNHS